MLPQLNILNITEIYPQRLTNQPSLAEELDSDGEGSSLSHSVLK